VAWSPEEDGLAVELELALLPKSVGRGDRGSAE